MIERTNTNWIQTFTGKQFWPMSPRVEDVDILDICWALSNRCRFSGHCDEFYSVENHSVLTYELSTHYTESPLTQLFVLLHDACEAYMPDVAKPIKQHLPEIVAMEKRLTECIYEALVGRQPDGRELGIIKEVDFTALKMERYKLMPDLGFDWGFPWISGNHADTHPVDTIRHRGTLMKSAYDHINEIRRKLAQELQRETPPKGTT